MLGFIKSLFSMDKVVDSGIRIVDKIAGTDGMTANEKADFLLKYQEATKHQSPARRFIALAVTLLYVIYAIAYGVLVVVGNMLDSSGVLAASVGMLEFMKESISNPFNIILVFYFTVQIANGLKGR